MDNLNLLIIVGCFIITLLILRSTPNDKIREMGNFFKKLLVPLKDIIDSLSK